MKLNLRSALAFLWSGPDPVLAQAGIAGELFVAKIRFALAVLILLIPVIDALFFKIPSKEGIVGLSLATATFVLAGVMYLLLSREYNPPWLTFVTTSFDVSLISASLALFLLLNEPHTAVNSKVVFEGYFLAIGASSFRYDKRVCITAGVLAVIEYFAIVDYAATHWDLNNPIYAPFPYGQFDWSYQISRMILMLVASALSLALVSRSQRLLQLATSDPLTGLFNRGYIDERFAVELSRARRYHKQLTLAVIDVDRFKMLNDNYGHASGDVVLRKIGAILRESFRQSDTVGRYGGEEFIVILPEMEMEAGRQKLESLRQRLAHTRIGIPHRNEQVQITISVGLSTFPSDGEDSACLISLADKRMFRAKRQGRNQVVADDSLPLNPAPPSERSLLERTPW
jgi:two-component system cell cycle response regulator